MRTTWIGRGAATVAAGLIFIFGSSQAAFAAATIEINAGNVPTTAQAATHGCDFGGGPFANQDVWIFVLPEPNLQGDFTSLTVTFTDAGNVQHVLSIPADGGAIVDDNGTSKAYLATPAGWTLVNGSADITGTDPQNAKFNLTHACPATGSPSAGPSASTSPSTPPTASPSPFGGGESPSASTAASASTTPAESESPTPGESTSASTSGTPVPSGSVNTGGGGSAMSMSSVFLGGGALLGAVAGIGFLVLARQRRDLA
ncbi:hypothetical protein HDA40_005677 [Hamadaea flava]|uniref:Gram-positive cocci surface proteins LPxTG domain-containing protein n=1 Tax=Hamadaea flava TaxID=1742688 RepID=A0ABV8LSJ8_9ACTN|nr:hypothetical protein [Hamadaea flava]MCP2327170.1 hypothetical protein [Hamadaea flava]